MNITISYANLTYALVTLAALFLLLHDIFRVIPGNGGYFSESKQRGEIGCSGVVIIAIWVIFTLVFGGFFWW